MSNVFWILATLEVLVSIGVEGWIWLIAKRGHKSERSTAVAIGQRKDIWLVCCIVWIVLIGDHVSSWSLLHAAGASTLLWRLWRTLQRLRLFASGR